MYAITCHRKIRQIEKGEIIILSEFVSIRSALLIAANYEIGLSEISSIKEGSENAKLKNVNS